MLSAHHVAFSHHLATFEATVVADMLISEF
jgi:hypothetical protein